MSSVQVGTLPTINDDSTILPTVMVSGSASVACSWPACVIGSELTPTRAAVAATTDLARAGCAFAPDSPHASATAADGAPTTPAATITNIRTRPDAIPITLLPQETDCGHDRSLSLVCGPARCRSQRSSGCARPM